MLLAKVVDTSRRITDTSKRLEKIELLATLLKQAQPQEIEIVVAFLSGVVLVASVIFVHGFPALQMIWASIAALIGTSAWNVFLRQRRPRPLTMPSN